MVPDDGIEPPTFGLQNHCSTAELIRLCASFYQNKLHFSRTENFAARACLPAISLAYLWTGLELKPPRHTAMSKWERGRTISSSKTKEREA